MKLLIENVCILTMNESFEIIEQGSILIDGNRLAYVGPAESIPAGPFHRIIEAGRMIAMPGMMNAHCHSPANLVRGMMPSKPLEIWRAYYRASLRGMRDEDFYASALTRRHGNAQDRDDYGSGSFLWQPRLPVHGCRRGDSSNARFGLTPCRGINPLG